MPTQFFDNTDDTFAVTAAGDYFLTFLGGEDELTATGGTNIFAAMGEDDDIVKLLAGSGFYKIYGESGDDRFDLYNGNGAADGGEGGDIFNIRGGSGHIVAGREGVDRFTLFTDVNLLNLFGGSDGDIFVGNGHTAGGEIHGEGGDDFFTGFASAGALSIFGGIGNDLYRADPTAPATFVENVGEGTDTVQVARGQSFTLAANIENLIVVAYAGSTLADTTLTGNDLGNVIWGSANNDTIIGLGGNDTLAGFGGDDIMNGNSGNDRLYGSVGNDTLSGGIDHDLLDGGAGNDTLNGNDGNDILNGRAGDDSMTGGTGNDRYFVDSLGDTVVESPGGGIDTIRTSVSLTLGENIERAALLGTGNLSLTGNDEDNLLYGNSGNNFLDGWSGDDVVVGGAGDDILLGLDGNDRLFGGEGDDSIDGESGVDVLSGGAGEDTYDFDFVSQSPTGSPDQILDFLSLNGEGVGDDQLDLSTIDANTAVLGDQAFTYTNGVPTANSVWFANAIDNGDGTFEVTIFADVNGDTTPEFEIQVHFLSNNLWADDIIL